MIANIRRNLCSQQICTLNKWSHKLLTNCLSFAHLSQNICNQNYVGVNVLEVKACNSYLCFKKWNKTTVYCTWLETSIKDSIIVCNCVSQIFDGINYVFSDFSIWVKISWQVQYVWSFLFNIQIWTRKKGAKFSERQRFKNYSGSVK